MAAPLAPAQATYFIETGTPTGEMRYTVYDDGAMHQKIAASFSLFDVSHVQTIEAYLYAGTASTITMTLYTTDILPQYEVFSKSFTTTVGEGWQGLTNLDLLLYPRSYFLLFTSSETRGTHSLRSSEPNQLDYVLYNNQGSQGWRLIPDASIGLRISDETLAAVPEPASWAMMIGGFALMGGALRRRTANGRRMTVSFA
jgi:hypothetical protein